MSDFKCTIFELDEKLTLELPRVSSVVGPELQCFLKVKPAGKFDTQNRHSKHTVIKTVGFIV